MAYAKISGWKARAEAAEKNIEEQVINAIKNRVALLEMQRDEARTRAEAAEEALINIVNLTELVDDLQTARAIANAALEAKP